MTHSLTQQAAEIERQAVAAVLAMPLTAGTATYEASSLLSSYQDTLPQPVYITVNMNIHSDGASIGLNASALEDVHTWARAFPDAKIFTSRTSSQPGTCTRAEFTHPFDRRIEVCISCVIYDDEDQPQ